MFFQTAWLKLVPTGHVRSAPMLQENQLSWQAIRCIPPRLAIPPIALVRVLG